MLKIFQNQTQFTGLNVILKMRLAIQTSIMMFVGKLTPSIFPALLQFSSKGSMVRALKLMG